MAHTYQWMSLALLILALIYSLIQLKSDWFSADNLSIVLSQIKVSLLFFLIKICMCYDHHLDQPWIEGAFGGMPHFYVLLLSIGLSVNTIVSYNVFGSHLLSFVATIVLTLIEIWSTILVIKLWQIISSEETKTDPIVKSELKVNFPESLRKHYKDLLGEKTIVTAIGWSRFAATFRSDYKPNEKMSSKVSGSMIANDFAFKVIDLKEYIRFRFGDLTADEESEEIRKFNRDYRFLLQISHKNIFRFIRVDRFSSKSGQLRRIVLVSKMATRCLNSYLKSEAPYGVGHELARHWFKQLVSAVHYLHCQINKDQPIAHMNIKPENILLFAIDEQNKDFNLKLSDCGLDLYFSKSGQIKTDDNKYLISAPEYILGKKIARFHDTRGVDPLASDIYSLGVILILLLKGEVSQFVEIPKQMDKIREKQTVVNAIYVDFSFKTSRNSAKKLFSKKEDKQLIHLLEGMLERKAENRFDIIVVKNHPWIKSKQN